MEICEYALKSEVLKLEACCGVDALRYSSSRVDQGAMSEVEMLNDEVNKLNKKL